MSILVWRCQLCCTSHKKSSTSWCSYILRLALETLDPHSGVASKASKACSMALWWVTKIGTAKKQRPSNLKKMLNMRHLVRILPSTFRGCAGQELHISWVLVAALVLRWNFLRPGSVGAWRIAPKIYSKEISWYDQRDMQSDCTMHTAYCISLYHNSQRKLWLSSFLSLGL